MRINARVLTILAAICIVTIGFAIADEQKTSTSLNDNELVQNITKNLSVKPEQAAGGIGSLLGYAKGKLTADDFDKVSKAIPQTDTLISAAPKQDSAISSAMAKLGSNAAGISSLAGSFQQLGLSPDMVTKFVPEILNFTQAKGGEATKNILANVLK
jgi:hypothetical protein